MKKKIYVLLISAAMMVLVTACGSEAPANEIQNELEQVEEELETVVEEMEEVEKEQQDLDEGQPATGEDGLEALEEKVIKDVEETISALTEEYNLLIAKIDTYEKYLESVETVEGFYAKVLAETESIFTRLQEYCVEYANVILTSDKENDEKYEDFDEMYDCVYEDACDEVYDEIYEGIMKDIYDTFYDGILDDAKDNADYGEWLDVRSNEYELWLDIRSDVYEEWLDSRSDIYEFWLDIRGEMWDDDSEKAQEIVEDFKEDIAKRIGDMADNEAKEGESLVEAENSREEDTSASDTAVKEDSDAKAADDSEDLVDGMRPEFKAAMDSYEEFYEEYCEVLKKYKENPADVTILTEYSELMEQSIEMGEKFEEWDEDELNADELKYYVEVNGRVTQMLVEVGVQ